MRKGQLLSTIDALTQVYRFADLIQLTVGSFLPPRGELGVFSIFVVQLIRSCPHKPQGVCVEYVKTVISYPSIICLTFVR